MRLRRAGPHRREDDRLPPDRQVFRKKPTEKQFKRAVQLADEGGVTAPREAVRADYINTPIPPRSTMRPHSTCSTSLPTTLAW